MRLAKVSLFAMALPALAIALFAAPAHAQFPFLPPRLLAAVQQTAPKKNFVRRLNPFRRIDTSSPTFQLVTAQFAHVGAGYSVTMGMRVAGHNTAGLAAIGGWTLGKELWFDRKYEGSKWKEVFRDIAFYGLGIGIAEVQKGVKR